ncbi:helix-turn-helix transcriptional regulator [Avibacterium sp. 20-15]|uniref:winged helix-turn-helix transcriptional regulator n=1 Tax=unclassified Avibacterium TaxID=2685287 RepID=UPI002027139D|nr:MULTISPECIES: helix-turn-helix domain-containing protein [unclassified Avibacterium]MCW9732098.1 helix-turn-helix transcriptional regulator [Avibacterium sp. 20-15]URL04276.1 helix-turn-helix transcriptional regulator [Avibacterium sp. 20-132]URL05799.1 helix-turn-helix transcriptional regulator [Avibacterium sp. 21-595]
MLKETDKKLPDCEVEITLMMMSERWRVLIIRELLSGTKRFGELKKTLNGISQKVLTANLRAMESQGLLTRKVYAEVPPRVEYTLTEDGISLKSVLDAMAIWGESYRQKYKNR